MEETQAIDFADYPDEDDLTTADIGPDQVGGGVLRLIPRLALMCE